MKKQIIPSDSELVALFKKGDDTAFGKIIERHNKSIMILLFNIVQDTMLAEDLLQETFIKAMTAIRTGHYRETYACKTWLHRIAHNLAMDVLRKQKKMPSAFSISTTGDFEESDNETCFPISNSLDKNEEEKILTQENKCGIRDLINLLPHEQRKVVMLRYFYGLTFQEIAEHTDVSVNTALGRMRYALIHLRKHLRESGSA